MTILELFSSRMSLPALLLLLLLSTITEAQRSLGSYNVDTSAISTSGISSGGAMATQLHVAFSADIMGVGVLAGNPYYCAMGSLMTGFYACANLPDRVDVEVLVDFTRSFAAQGLIDATQNMENSKVFVFHGKSDSVVDPKESEAVVAYYEYFVKPENIKTSFELDAGHTHPSLNYGNDCKVTRSPFISACDYPGSYEVMNWIYGGNLQRPPGDVPLTGDFYQFNQKEFFGVGGPQLVSMDDIGFVYVPSRCIDSQKACRLHVAFHGCVQGRDSVGDIYGRHAGYSEAGELNDIIILYPQAIKSLVTPLNPQGCWDWWGYTDDNYANQRSQQMKGVMAMVNRIIGPK